MNSVLFFLFGILVLVFVVFKILDPSSENRESNNSLEGIDTQAQADVANTLLKVGPMLLGFGMIGYLIKRFWDMSDVRLLIASILLVACTSLGYLFYYLKKTKPENAKIFSIYSDTLFLVGSFLVGAVLFSINGFFNDKFGYLVFGSSEIFGIWSLALLPFLYLTRSFWMLAIAVGVHLFWITPYLNDNLNLIRLFDFGLQSRSSTSVLGFVLLPSIGVAIYSLLYTWHQHHNHNKPNSGWRPFYYVMGMFTFFTAGALVLKSINDNYSVLNKDGNTAVISNLILAAFILLMFTLDFVFKKSIKNYSINIFAAISITLAGLIGASIPALYNNQQAFLPLYFLEVPFVIWLLADFLRHKSQLSEIMFYTISPLQLLLITSDPSPYNWFKLICLLGIMLYAAWEHLNNRVFVYYVLGAGAVAIAWKLVVSSKDMDPFFIVMIVGLLLCAYGGFYSFSRKKLEGSKLF